MGLLASSLAAAQPLPDGRPKVLVLEIEASQGVTKATAEVSTALLLGKLRQLPSIHVMAYRDVEGAMTQEQRRMLAGCDEVSCAAEIAGALNADQVVLGRLGKLGTQYVLYLSRIEQRGARPLANTTRQFSATGDEAVAEQIAPAVRELFPDAFPPPPATPLPPVAAPGAAAAAPTTVIIQQAPAAEQQSASSRMMTTALKSVGAVFSGAGLLLFFTGAVAVVSGASLVGLYVYAFYIIRDIRLSVALVPAIPLAGLVAAVGVLMGMFSLGAVALGVLMLVSSVMVE